MSPAAEDDSESAPSRRLEAIRAAGSLDGLRDVLGAESAHEAYFSAKREWFDRRDRDLSAREPADGLPGDRVEIDGRSFHVHGVTHAGTRAERAYLRDHVGGFLREGAAVYCEQGIRSMYFADFPDVCEMDDYRWAMERCDRLAAEAGDARSATSAFDSFDGFDEGLDTLVSSFRESVFSLIESNSDLYGEAFAAALGDVASSFLTSHEDLSTGDEFEAFAASRRAANDPGALPALQRYYKRSFLPPPLEREWLRRHDPELEVVTHARDERMAEYAVFHNDDAPAAHLIVGAAHHPGVVYYLERIREEPERVADFRLVD